MSEVRAMYDGKAIQVDERDKLMAEVDRYKRYSINLAWALGALAVEFLFFALYPEHNGWWFANGIIAVLIIAAVAVRRIDRRGKD